MLWGALRHPKNFLRNSTVTFAYKRNLKSDILTDFTVVYFDWFFNTFRHMNDK